MRVLIFGANGQLGRALVETFGWTGPVSGCGTEVDVRDPSAVAKRMHEFRPELVINAAAYTDVEKAETNPSEAFAVNRMGATIVAMEAARADVRLVHMSTDYVFGGGRNSPYIPGDVTDPLNVYGNSKRDGEWGVCKASSKYFIVRTAWLYGPGGDNFVGKILRIAEKEDSIRVVDDRFGSPTYVLDLARTILVLSGTYAYGIHHAVNEGVCSRFEFASEIVKLAGLKCEVLPCESSEFPTTAVHPERVELDMASMIEVTGKTMRPWRDALAEYMKGHK